MKRVLSAALCAVLAFSLMTTAAFASAGLGNFQKTKTYTEGSFKDLSQNAWYLGSVRAAYELSLMDGQGAGSFAPDSNVKLSEAIAMAARLHSIYNTGTAEFAQSSPWYQSYVDYAVSNRIIRENRFENYELYATRYQFAEIFAAALPSSALSPINNISTGQIPDLSYDAPYEHVYLLYRAGVLTGDTEYGYFRPSDNILRSECAAVVTRMADASLRVSFTIKEGGSENPVSESGLAESVRLARAGLVSGLDFLSTSQAAFGSSEPLLAVTFKANALESVLTAAQRSMDAAAFCKDSEKYSSLYSDLELGRLSATDAAKAISGLNGTSLPGAWNDAVTLIYGASEALARAAAALEKIV